MRSSHEGVRASAARCESRTLRSSREGRDGAVRTLPCSRRAARLARRVRSALSPAARATRRGAAAQPVRRHSPARARERAGRRRVLRQRRAVHAARARDVARGACGEARAAARGGASGRGDGQSRLSHAARCRSRRRRNPRARPPPGRAARRFLSGRRTLRMTGGARRVTTPDGVDLALHRLRAFRDGRPAVLLIHGAFTNHRFWLHAEDGISAGGMAHFLGAAGLDVWLADMRHHGESAREPRRGAWTFEDWVLHDTPTLVARVREETDGAPLAWIGHSAGGAAGLCWLARVAAAAPLRAIVTLGTPGPRRLGLLRRTLAATTIAMSRAVGPFPARAPRFGNEDEAAEIIAEWMEWNVRGQWLGTDGFDYFAGLTALTVPYLGVAGGADRIFAPPAACRQVVERVGAARKSLQIEPGLSHRGLVLSERARIACWPNIVAWLKE